MKKSEIEALVSDGNEVEWRHIPHIGAKGNGYPSLLQVTEGLLIFKRLSTFLEDLKTTKNSVIFIHPKPDEDEVLWDGMVRYRIIPKIKLIPKIKQS